MPERTIRLAVIGGDGIGPEVETEALKVLRAAAPDVVIEETGYDLGARRWHATGEVLPDSVLDELRGHDAILLGAVGVSRVVRYASGRAAQRPRRKLTLVHNTNELTHAGDLWQRAVQQTASQFAEVSVDYCHVDAASMFLVTDPERFDVIVTDNLFGDILTDLGAAVAGGIGLAASANINPERMAPSMFEPVHGSAPDLAGQQKADPTAAILSAAMLCEHLGFTAEAARIEQATE